MSECNYFCFMKREEKMWACLHGHCWKVGWLGISAKIRW